MICQTRKPKQQTFPISFHHPIGSVMSLLSQLSYESSKTELVKKQPAARGKKIFQPKKKPAQRGRKKVSGRPDSSSPWWRCVGGGGGVGGVPEASNRISKSSQTARDVYEFWSVQETEEQRRSSCEVRYYLFF